jgi:hypothetical protein
MTAALASTSGAAEQPGFSAKGDTAHAALGGVVGEQMRTSSRVRVNASQRLRGVVHGLGDVVAARELGGLLSSRPLDWRQAGRIAPVELPRALRGFV